MTVSGGWAAAGPREPDYRTALKTGVQMLSGNRPEVLLEQDHLRHVRAWLETLTSNEAKLVGSAV